VNVGDGQTKTYIGGIADTSSIQDNGAGGITFGYTSYGGMPVLLSSMERQRLIFRVWLTTMGTMFRATSNSERPAGS
jgi:hypothetical protein